MSGAEWRAIAVFAVTALALSYLDNDLALGLVVIVGLIVVLTTMSG